MNFLGTFIAIEQLVFVCAFLILADSKAFLYAADTARLEKLNLFSTQFDFSRHLL
jgi:hypothetical protein